MPAIAAFIIFMSVLFSMNPSSSYRFSEMTEPIVVEQVYNGGYVLKDSVGVIVFIDSRKKKWNFLQQYVEKDTVEYKTRYLFNKKDRKKN